MQTLHHKKNEKQEVEFFQDKECIIPFDFTNAKELYIELKDGDISPITALPNDIRRNANIYIPYIPQNQKPLPNNVKTLDDITPNLSKYIPEDNAVLFLSGEDCEQYMSCFQNHHIGLYANDGLDKVTLEGSINAINEFVKNPIQKLTTFLPHGTQAELQKANEVAKELKEKYGVEKVNLFVLHWLDKNLYELIQNKNGSYTSILKYININKIITTNSTGILPVQNTERLQVIDCYDIFNEYLKTER